MARMPGAIWKPVVNHASGAIGPVVGMVVHHMVGSEASAYSRFNQPGSGASAHFGVTFDGTIFQYVDTNDAAYHACQANYQGQVGVENESLPDPAWEPLTAEQVAANGRIARWLADEHGMVLRVADPDDRRGVGYHSMVPGPCGQAWGQTGCPGEAIANQRGEIVAAAQGVSAEEFSVADIDDLKRDIARGFEVTIDQVNRATDAAREKQKQDIAFGFQVILDAIAHVPAQGGGTIDTDALAEKIAKRFGAKLSKD